MTDIEECLISMDGIIQEVRPAMTVEESDRLQERLIRGNLNILISIARIKPELKAYYNGNGKRNTRTEQEEEKSGPS